MAKQRQLPPFVHVDGACSGVVFRDLDRDRVEVLVLRSRANDHHTLGTLDAEGRPRGAYVLPASQIVRREAA